SLPGIIVIRFEGAITIADREQAMNQVAGSFNHPATIRVLIDLTQGTAVRASLDETNRFASKVASTYRVLNGRIAYLCKSSDPDPASVEGIAAAKGYFYERFTSEASAIRWLETGLNIDSPLPRGRKAKANHPRG
ncbi:MAG: hypothetical protein JWL98_1334, partial [Xanthomonadaceae bacterium]|nr:hypothetical protein [Xanthomonadaceae bacterium]